MWIAPGIAPPLAARNDSAHVLPLASGVQYADPVPPKAGQNVLRRSQDLALLPEPKPARLRRFCLRRNRVAGFLPGSEPTVEDMNVRVTEELQEPQSTSRSHP